MQPLAMIFSIADLRQLKLELSLNSLSSLCNSDENYKLKIALLFDYQVTLFI